MIECILLLEFHLWDFENSRVLVGGFVQENIQRRGEEDVFGNIFVAPLLSQDVIGFFLKRKIKDIGYSR